MEFSVNKSYYYYLMFSQLHSLILVLGSCKIPTLACGIDLGFLKGQDALEISSAGWKRTGSHYLIPLERTGGSEKVCPSILSRHMWSVENAPCAWASANGWAFLGSGSRGLSTPLQWFSLSVHVLALHFSPFVQLSLSTLGPLLDIRAIL